MLTFIEMGLTLLAVLAVAYLAYVLFYSDREVLRKAKLQERVKWRLDRREQERQDRRKRTETPPGGIDRRSGERSRRAGD